MATKKSTKPRSVSSSTMALSLPLTVPAPTALDALRRWRDDNAAGDVAIHHLAAAIVKRRPRAYRELEQLLHKPALAVTVDDVIDGAADSTDGDEAPRLAALFETLSVDDVRAAAGDDLADFSADELFAVVRGGAWRQWLAGDVATLRTHVAPRTALPAPLLKLDVDAALKTAAHRALVEPLLRRAAQVTRALAGPAPIVLDDGYGYLDERRAFLAKAMQRRTPPPMATLRARTIHVDERGMAVDVDGTFAKEPVHLELPAARIDSGGSWAVDEAVWSAAFDVVNEPEPHEAAYFSRWFGGESVALLEALQAVVSGSSSSRTAATAGSERIAWQIHHQRDGLLLTPRRQKVMKRGWSNGTALDPGRVLLDDDDVITGVDRHVASLLCGAKSGEGRALAALAGHPAVYDRDNRVVDISVADVSVGIDDLPGGARRVSLRVGGRAVEHDDDDDNDHAVIGDDFVALVDTSAKVAHFTVGLLDDAMVRLARALQRTSVLPAALTPALRALADTAAATPSLDGSSSTSTSSMSKLVLPDSLQGDLVPGAPRVVVRLALGEPLRLTATIAVIAGPGAPPALPLDDDNSSGSVDSAFVAGFADGRRVRYARSAAVERALVEPIRTGLLEGIVGDERFDPVEVTAHEIVADGDDALVLLRRAQGLQSSGVDVLWRDQRRLQVVGTVKASSLKLRVSAAREWLGLEGQGVIDGEAVALATLLAASREQRRFIALGPDRYVAVDRALREALGRVADLSSEDHDPKKSGFAVEAPLAVAQALSSLRQAGAAIEDTTVWHDLEARLQRAADVDDVPPAALLAELRPYQRDGLLFLRRLAAFGTGGVLADDMGLGKTVQAIGLLVDRVDVGPAIVVAPTSLVFNWQRELVRFAPSLRVHVYGDAVDRRALLDGLGAGDVVIATWGLLDGILDQREGFADARFATAIFDEAQAIKNADTQRARAARDLVADIKIALSGTPLENHLGELWSLFRVVTPGLLGGLDVFRRRFLVPIERDRSAAHRRRLGETVRPFLLRRTRDEVLTDLPPLTQQLVELSASEPERVFYDALRTEILEDIGDGAVSADSSLATQQRFKILAGLTRLRLACCHPLLVEPTYDGPSTKLDEAVATLLRVREAGHRALVFSQFVKFLDLVEPALQAAGLKTLRLDGSTPEAERRVRVDAFQRGEADVFVLSLKAGGAGLNLTAADVVVHLDPWWNPAVEAQAVSRAHRMGRAAPVTAIRLVVHDTIEAQILELHDDKRELVDGVLAGAAGASRLGLDEIAALLRR